MQDLAVLPVDDLHAGPLEQRRVQLHGRVVSVVEDGGASLIEVDIGGATVLARISAAATRELLLQPGKDVWVLVKAVSFSVQPLGKQR